MKLPLVILPRAEADLAEARNWYELQRPGLGDALLESVEGTLLGIQHFSERSARSHRDFRIASVRRFPYMVIFRLADQQITVHAIYHARRDPRGWQAR